MFEKKFKQSLFSSVPLLDRILHYIIKRKGKQMRPMFVFLSAKLFGNIEEKTYRAASMIELLHTATLVHDDVIDESNLRRGFFSINALWKNKVAILVGDFLLSKGLLLAVKNKDYQMLEIMSEAVEEMSEGELLQIEKTRRLDVTEEIYFKIIKKKTASLIAACCASGAYSSKQNQSVVDKLKLFGENVGMAFQIKDDLFDYNITNFAGKPVAIDIKEKKITLPLIYTLNRVDKNTKKYLINIVKNSNQNEKKIIELVQIVKDNGGINYAESKMKEYHKRAKEILTEFENNEARKSLLSLLNFVIERKK